MKSHLTLFLVLLATLTSTHALESRDKAEKLAKDGNFKEALALYREILADPANGGKAGAEDVEQVNNCIRSLNDYQAFDSTMEPIAANFPNDWRVLAALGNAYASILSNGFIVAGEFQRGYQRGDQGDPANASARDRVRCLQLMHQATANIPKDEADIKAVSTVYQNFASAIMGNFGYAQSWHLQDLTDLKTLPDYEASYQHNYARNVGTPVNADGSPLFYYLPKTWDAAKNDGERWRWLLQESARWDPSETGNTILSFLQFLEQQFSVATLRQGSYGGWFGRQSPDDTSSDHTYELHTLKESETICNLATGIKRITLPDEFNHIAWYRKLATDPLYEKLAETALSNLAQIFENRRQYPAAAALWKESIERFTGSKKEKRARLAQIVGNWGRFDPATPQPAGAKATVGYVFRNGKKVSFEARAIDSQKLIADIQAYLASNPVELEHDKIQLHNIGYSLVNDHHAKYVKDKVASWELELSPRANHWDRRIDITTPLDKPGAYLLEATMEDGNKEFIVIWIDDTVIVKKALDEQTYIYLADATTGEPVANATVNFFGYQTEYLDKKKLLSKRRANIITKQHIATTDADGQVFVKEKAMPNNHQWLITARTDSGRFAYHGFTGIWYSKRYDADYQATKFFTITDRPVYRPTQDVEFKTWIAHAQYDKKDGSQFANQKFIVIIHDPKNEKIFEQTFTTDAFGGLSGKFPLKDEATLGIYTINTLSSDHSLGGSNTFRVEEYKKPEFEVTIDAPTEPVMLGEKIPATIKAKYYFGAPVLNATVKYKVLRSEHDARWFAPMRWDWFYGSGYWWSAYDYSWYPGWNRWGCLAPHWYWWPRANTPPEVVLEGEVPIGEDGTVKVEIDTALAKAIHGDIDHKYEITAEVRDESRRTIVGKGNVLVAREPFKVHVWVDRGYYRAGDVIDASACARTLDGKNVEGQGKFTLYKISYNDERKPVEKEVASWAINPAADGYAQQQIKASEKGQYRLAYTLTDKNDHRIEGGYVFVVRGDGFDGKEFRFNELELITDKKEYAPGETVRVMINTDRSGGTVALFLRPSNGICLPPKIIRLKGKSSIYDLEVVQKDMPNFFIEAFTVSSGKLYEQMREIVVPPEKRVINVEVLPDAPEYKPGGKAKIKVRLTDFDGAPFVGNTVVSVYDKSLEYISGGSNVPEIREFFWKWRRQHNISTENSLTRWFQNVGKRGKAGMNALGIFGDTAAVESLLALRDNFGAGMGGGGFGSRAGMAKSVSRYALAAPSSAAPMPTGVNPITAGLRSGASAIQSDAIDSLLTEDSDQAPSQESEPSPEATPAIRENFADLAFWAASLTTDKDGITEVEIDMPENLTTWKIRTWSMGSGTNVGQGEAEIITSKDLIIRMQAPRFFVETDEVVLSANVHNYLDTAKDVRVVLEIGNDALAPVDGVSLEQTTNIDAGGEKRIDWRVRVMKEGEAEITMKALTDEESDAMLMRYPVFVHGMLKTESFSGAIRPDKDTGTITLNIPAERRPEQTTLEVRYSPTIAMAMVDALPYLANYPYGCTEQTLNRFVPTVITQKILQEMDIDLKDIKKKRSNLNPQEIGKDRKRARQWKHWDENPVFDTDSVNDMVSEGIERLTFMQNKDGGWGWFSGSEENSYPHTTATVVHGLQIAKANGANIPENVLKNGVNRLKKFQANEIRLLKRWPSEKRESKEFADNEDALVFMVLCDAGEQDSDMRDFLYRDRNQLSVYGKALTGLAMHKIGREKERDMLIRNIEQFLKTDDENQSAWLELGNGNYWWRWYGSEFEAHAAYLRLLAATSPKSPHVSGLVKYLVNNRKHATYWNSTRDTAYCIEALADYIRASGEDSPDMTVEILLDGNVVKEVAINKDNLFTYDNKLQLKGDALTNGEHKVEFRKKGTGPLYYNAYLTNFTLEDFITKAGLEVKVERQYYKLIPEEKEIRNVGARGQSVGQKVEKFRREPLKSGDTLASGDLVEIELVIDSKNDYEYLAFEDMKASGFEPVAVQSGYTKNGMGAYMELRDERVVFFVRQLSRGQHSIAYRMRAETPGQFSALPAKASAMYAPELKANSDEMKISITE